MYTYWSWSSGSPWNFCWVLVHTGFTLQTPAAFPWSNWIWKIGNKSRSRRNVHCPRDGPNAKVVVRHLRHRQAAGRRAGEGEKVDEQQQTLVHVNYLLLPVYEWRRPEPTVYAVPGPNFNSRSEGRYYKAARLSPCCKSRWAFHFFFFVPFQTLDWHLATYPLGLSNICLIFTLGEMLARYVLSGPWTSFRASARGTGLLCFFGLLVPGASQPTISSFAFSLFPSSLLH